MQTAIRITPSYNASDSLILLLDDNGTLPQRLFNREEADFVQKELKAEHKNIVINQYKRRVFIFQPDYKKSTVQLLESCRKTGDTFQGLANKQQVKRLVIVDHAGKGDCSLALAEGAALGNYQFLKYKTKDVKKETNSLKEIAIKSRSVKPIHVSNLQHVVDAVCQARTLVNEPQSWLTATKLGSEFTRLGREAGFKVNVLKKQRIKALKMGGLLAVNQGSQQPPTFTIMEYKPGVEKVTIELTNGEMLKDIRVCDLSGRIVREIFSIKRNSVVIEKGNLASGLYLLRINSGNQEMIGKICFE